MERAPGDRNDGAHPHARDGASDGQHHEGGGGCGAPQSDKINAGAK